jgi:hypothetical protein
VTQTNSFGRRQPGSAVQPAKAQRPARPTPPSPSDLSPSAEAFRLELAARKDAPRADFADWRRANAGRQVAMWAITLLSFAPGLISLGLDLPLELSIGLELAAVAGNVWLRRERWRRMREIVAWQDPADAG